MCSLQVVASVLPRVSGLVD